jgi:hypothetical protein
VAAICPSESVYESFNNNNLIITSTSTQGAVQLEGMLIYDKKHGGGSKHFLDFTIMIINVPGHVLQPL